MVIFTDFSPIHLPSSYTVYGGWNWDELEASRTLLNQEDSGNPLARNLSLSLSLMGFGFFLIKLLL